MPTSFIEELLKRLPLGSENRSPGKTGLILSGGGARAAYQVGVLKAIAEILPATVENPFPIICGTSAGAVNAAALATRAPDFRGAVDVLDQVWSSFRAQHIYRTGFFSILGGILRWLRHLSAGVHCDEPMSLLDNRPLGQFIANSIPLERLEEVIAAGHLHALSITAGGYTSGLSHSFFQGVPGLRPWDRCRRIGVPAKISVAHLLASSAIPLVFPAVKIGTEYFGDGAIRQHAPISPAIQLGANRVFVIGLSENRTSRYQNQEAPHYPSMAKIAGHVFDSAFLDSMNADMERLERINGMISLIPDRLKGKDDMALQPVEMMSISPSESLDVIAARHTEDLPRTIRFFLHRSGATHSNAASILSYLLFEGPYCRELIRLGYRDSMNQEEEIRKFLDT